MPSTLSVRRIREEDIDSYVSSTDSESAAKVNLPNFARSRAYGPQIKHGRSQLHAVHPAGAKRSTHLQPARPILVPSAVPSRQARRIPIMVRANRVLRTALVAFCGIAIVGYGLDVASSNDVGKMQEQARRLNEQNCELSAQLLRAISFQGIQDSVVGRFGLRVPEQVVITHEVAPPEVPAFKASQRRLPIMSGY